MDTRFLSPKPSVKAAVLLGSLLTALCVTVYVAGIPFVDWLNLKIADSITMDRGAGSPLESPITVVDIDDEALNTLGQWPWPRYRLARLLQQIAQAGARSIGLAIILAEPDRTSLLGLQETILREFGQKIDLHKIPSEMLDNDLILAEVLTQGPFVLGYEFTPQDASHPVSACRLHPLSVLHVQNDAARPRFIQLYEAPTAICNLNLFAEAVDISGFLNGTPDPDGLLRRIPLIMRHADALYPNLALAVLLRAGVHRPLRLSQDGNGQLRLYLNAQDIPLDRHGNLYIRFQPNADFRRISAARIMNGGVAGDDFRDRLVFVGLSASGLGARFPTNAGPQTSAVEIHAQAAAAILGGAFIQRPPNMVLYEIVVSVLLALGYGWCLTHLGVAANTAYGGLGLLGVWFGTRLLFQTRRVLFSPLLPASVLLTVGVSLMLLQLWRRQRTAQLRQQDALVLMKGSESRLNAIIQTIPDIVFRLDASGCITFISPAVMKYQREPEEFMGQHILDIVAPEDRSVATHRINERRTGTRATTDLEIKLVLAGPEGQDNSERYFSVSAEGIYTTAKPDKNHFVGTQGIARDITHRKQLESQLERSKKMEAIGSLAAGVAHDLNNILSGLVSYPELLLLDLPAESPLRQSIEAIQHSGQRAAAVVQDMLTIARQGVTNASAVNINHVVLEYLQSPEQARLLKNHPLVRMKTSLDESLLNVKGTAIHLAKIVMNLVHNAAEAMPAGGRVTIKTRNRYLDVPHRGYEIIPEGEYIRLCVADEGIGIAAKDLTRIFEPFFTKKMMGHSGTGLGMTVVWSTVKDHGGFIDLHSREGEGTRFEIYLPATREMPSQREARFVLEDYLGSEKILVVDDVPEQREIAEKMLSKLGYDVVSVPSGESAEVYLASHRIDLVVLDMVMSPGIDGLETYRRILKRHPQQKAIIASGYAESERVKQLQALGAGAYIRKPYTLEKIGLAVRGELDRNASAASPTLEDHKH